MHGAFIKPYMLKGVDCVVWHTKAQQSRFSMRDDSFVPCNSSFYANHLIGARRTAYSCGSKERSDGKCMLPDGEHKPYIVDPMRDGLEIIKSLSWSLNTRKRCVRRTWERKHGQVRNSITMHRFKWKWFNHYILTMNFVEGKIINNWETPSSTKPSNLF